MTGFAIMIAAGLIMFSAIGLVVAEMDLSEYSAERLTELGLEQGDMELKVHVNTDADPTALGETATKAEHAGIFGAEGNEAVRGTAGAFVLTGATGLIATTVFGAEVNQDQRFATLLCVMTVICLVGFGFALFSGGVAGVSKGCGGPALMIGSTALMGLTAVGAIYQSNEVRTNKDEVCGLNKKGFWAPLGFDATDEGRQRRADRDAEFARRYRRNVKLRRNSRRLPALESILADIDDTFSASMEHTHILAPETA